MVAAAETTVVLAVAVEADDGPKISTSMYRRCWNSEREIETKEKRLQKQRKRERENGVKYVMQMGGGERKVAKKTQMAGIGVLNSSFSNLCLIFFDEKTDGLLRIGLRHRHGCVVDTLVVSIR